jgi:endonuclease YncB( thermonuclease family)
MNLELIRRGAASVWFFDGARGRYAGKLLAAARNAKAAHRGLWGACRGTKLNPLAALTATKPAPPPPASSSGTASNCDPS